MIKSTRIDKKMSCFCTLAEVGFAFPLLFHLVLSTSSKLQRRILSYLFYGVYEYHLMYGLLSSEVAIPVQGLGFSFLFYFCFSHKTYSLTEQPLH